MLIALISSSVAAKDFNFHSFSPFMTDDCSYFNTKEVEAKDQDGKVITGKKDTVTNFMSPTAHTMFLGGMSLTALASVGVFVYQYNQFLNDNGYEMTTESLLEFVNQSALAKVLVATGVLSTGWLTAKGITTLGQHFDFFMTDALVDAKLAEAEKLPTTEVAAKEATKDANGKETAPAVKAVTKEQAAKNKARIEALQKLVAARPAKAVEAPKVDATTPAATQAPKQVEAPKVEAPKVETPKVEAPKVDAGNPAATPVSAVAVEGASAETPVSAEESTVDASSAAAATPVSAVVASSAAATVRA